MAKAYKPLDETSSRNRLCLRCFHCKIQTFRGLDKLTEFCKKREFRLHLTWKRRLLKDGVLQIYWCAKSHKNPRIFRVCDSPFVANCKQFNGGDIDGTV